MIMLSFRSFALVALLAVLALAHPNCKAHKPGPCTHNKHGNTNVGFSNNRVSWGALHPAKVIETISKHSLSAGGCKSKCRWSIPTHYVDGDGNLGDAKLKVHMTEAVWDAGQRGANIKAMHDSVMHTVKSKKKGYRHPYHCVPCTDPYAVNSTELSRSPGSEGTDCVDCSPPCQCQSRGPLHHKVFYHAPKSMTVHKTGDGHGTQQITLYVTLDKEQPQELGLCKTLFTLATAIAAELPEVGTEASGAFSLASLLCN